MTTENLQWIKSSFSNSSCVEVAACADGRVAVRNSKDRSGNVVLYEAVEWSAFIRGVRNGEFDHFAGKLYVNDEE